MIKNQNPGGTKRRTGPKTERGKRHSSRNALRHGLSTPIEYDPHYLTLIDPLSRAILGDDVNPAHLPRARKVAQALLEVDRLRRFAVQGGHPARTALRQSYAESSLARGAPEASSRYLSRAYGRLRSSIKRLDEAQWRAHASIHPRPDGIAPIEVDLSQ
ncbi:MAG: hypothetical protein ORN52_09140 [Beijerinckiaceae bacterium]|nr:hypothetical protein [Beijerinckiaceae bacterium]